MSVCSQEMEDLKNNNNTFGDVALTVIGLGGAKNGSKRGHGIAIGVFIENHRGTNRQFFGSL